MNWLQKILSKSAAKMFTDQVGNHLYSAISNYINGDWQLLDAHRLMPTYRMQKYGFVEMLGKNIKIDGDTYYVKVFYEVRKKSGEIPELTWENNQNYPQVETEDASFYDSAYGQKLLSFRGYVEGRKGPNGPQHESDERIIPIPGVRGKMKRIGTFEVDDAIETPFAVAQFIRNSINRFFDFDGGETEQPPSRDPELSPELSPLV